MIGKVFLAEIHEMSRNTRSPNTVVEAMKRIMQITNKRTHSLYVLDLLKTLKKRGIGTNAMEQLIGKLCYGGAGRTVILEIVLKNRIRTTYKELRRDRYRAEKTWREEDDLLIHEGVLDGFLVIWAKEKERWRKILKEQRKRKVEWLVKKYRKKENLPDEYKGYSFKDTYLGEEFDNETVEYGGVEISEVEKEALKIHPKHTTYEEVDVMKLMAEVERSYTRVRWDRLSKERNAANNNSNSNNNNNNNNDFFYLAQLSYYGVKI